MGRRTRGSLVSLGLVVAVVVMEACAAAAPQIPPPRPIVVHSGARIRADHERMKEVNEWVTREQENIQNDPSFWVIGASTVDESFPWQGMVLGEDSVTVQMPLGGQDAALVYQIYGHLHLMVQMGRQEEWLPEAPDAVGYDLERAIVDRVADAWILGRSVFDTQPFGPLDELAYAKDAGYLDAFIFTARPDEFAESRTRWARENPGAMEEYRDWFLETFNREPPGLRAN
ncbi:MAG: hypothetical protein OEN56_08115 [Gemmatimonadota bacterium]|nr:hypothetical protein [Gemmatimonadota bacterium]